MKYLLATVLCLFLVACQSCPPRNDFVFIKAEPVQDITVESPDWKVLNQDQLKTEANDQSNKDKVWFVLTQEQFNQLMQSLNKIGGKIEEQARVILYYESSVDRYEEHIKQQK